MIEEEYHCNSLLNFVEEHIYFMFCLCLSHVSIQFLCVSDNYIGITSNFS